MNQELKLKGKINGSRHSCILLLRSKNWLEVLLMVLHLFSVLLQSQEETGIEKNRMTCSNSPS